MFSTSDSVIGYVLLGLLFIGMMYSYCATASMVGKHKVPVIAKVTRILREISLPGSIIICAMYFLMVYPTSTAVEPLSFFTHGVNALLMLLDACFTRARLQRTLFVWWFIFAILYLLWTVIMYSNEYYEPCDCADRKAMKDADAHRFADPEHEDYKPGCRLATEEELKYYYETRFMNDYSYESLCNYRYGAMNWNNPSATGITMAAIGMLGIPLVCVLIWAVVMYKRKAKKGCGESIIDVYVKCACRKTFCRSIKEHVWPRFDDYWEVAEAFSGMPMLLRLVLFLLCFGIFWWSLLRDWFTGNGVVRWLNYLTHWVLCVETAYFYCALLTSNLVLQTTYLDHPRLKIDKKKNGKSNGTTKSNQVKPMDNLVPGANGTSATDPANWAPANPSESVYGHLKLAMENCIHYHDPQAPNGYRILSLADKQEMHEDSMLTGVNPFVKKVIIKGKDELNQPEWTVQGDFCDETGEPVWNNDKDMREVMNRDIILHDNDMPWLKRWYDSGAWIVLDYSERRYIEPKKLIAKVIEPKLEQFNLIFKHDGNTWTADETGAVEQKAAAAGTDLHLGNDDKHQGAEWGHWEEPKTPKEVDVNRPPATPASAIPPATPTAAIVPPATPTVAAVVPDNNVAAPPAGDNEVSIPVPENNDISVDVPAVATPELDTAIAVDAPATPKTPSKENNTKPLAKGKAKAKAKAAA